MRKNVTGKGPRRDGEKERLWRRRLKEFERSGESIRGFCRSRDIPEPQFYAWRREIRRRDQEQLEKKQSAPLLAPVAIVEDLAAAVEPIELVLEQATLRIPPTATRESLATILDALESRRC
jgi:transposase-like protein